MRDPSYAVLEQILTEVQEWHPEVTAIYIAEGSENDLENKWPVLQVVFKEGEEHHDLEDYVDDVAWSAAADAARSILKTTREEFIR